MPGTYSEILCLFWLENTAHKKLTILASNLLLLLINYVFYRIIPNTIKITFKLLIKPCSYMSKNVLNTRKQLINYSPHLPVNNTYPPVDTGYIIGAGFVR